MKTRNHMLRRNATPGIFIILLLFTFTISCNDDESSDIETETKVTYSGSFVKSNNDVSTSGSGTVTGVLDSESREFAYTVTWSDLSSDAVAMHFHDDGPVIVDITGFPDSDSGTTSGVATFSASQVNDLASGKIYVQIHTSTYPGGEILATLLKGSSNPSNGGGGTGY
ncbi:CHRD domain-containing protein [Sunxiuqinia indica]|uniref:CHRD domain-containing protein n=1 Tax=Sunxiuqinia indica TaxID=2692584 RepID=UPI00135BF4D4|nr:CHRD domain-containing protein [Sunxiuqinia indica]